MTTMKLRSLFRGGVLAALALVFLAGPAAGRGQESGMGETRTVTAKDGETIKIRMRPAEAAKNIVSVITLPASVHRVVSAWKENQISIDQVENKLFMKLLAKGEGYLDVVTSEGTHFRFLLISVAPDAPYDSNVIVQTESDKGKTEERKTPRGIGPSGALELVKAMRLGEVPPDATVRSGKDELLFSDEGVEAKLRYVYETGRYRGYIVGLRNTSPTEATRVEVMRFRAEDLIAIGSKDVIVGPGRSTLLYLVFSK